MRFVRALSFYFLRTLLFRVFQVYYFGVLSTGFVLFSIVSHTGLVASSDEVAVTVREVAEVRGKVVVASGIRIEDDLEIDGAGKSTNVAVIAGRRLRSLRALALGDSQSVSWGEDAARKYGQRKRVLCGSGGLFGARVRGVSPPAGNIA